SLVTALRREINALDPDLPVYDVRMTSEIVSDSLFVERFSTTFLSIFAGIALTLAAIGIYAVTHYTVAQRTKEIGVRMALGAKRRDLLFMILGHTMKLTLLGLGLGLIIAFALTRVLAGLLFRVSVGDPTIYVGAVVLLTGAALLASYLAALKATRVNPIVALRYE